MEPKKRFRFPHPDVMAAIESSLPGSIADVSQELRMGESNVARYLRYMNETTPRRVYVSGYGERVEGRLTALPPRIWSVGDKPNVVFEIKAKPPATSTFQERMMRLQHARAVAQEERKLRKAAGEVFETDEKDDPRHLMIMHSSAQRLVNEALKHKNTAFGPLFDLAKLPRS